MTGSKLTVYADYEILENIALNSEKYLKMTEIFRRMSDICLNISDDRLSVMQTLTNDGNCDPVWQFIQDKDLPTPYALDSFFSQNEDIVYLFDPTAIFLLNKTKKETKELRDKYGVLVIGEGELSDDLLELKHKKWKEINKKDTTFGKDQNGWNTIFHDVVRIKNLPLNSAIVSDNYLMKNRNSDSFCGTANLLNLFSNILPAKLTVPFHILIICPDCPSVPRKAEKALEQFSEDVKKLRDYTIEVEFCLTSMTPVHHRRIYTNYYSITCEKGFSLFKVYPGNKVREDGNDVRIESYYHDPIYTSGDTARDEAYSDLEILKGIYKDEKKSAAKNRLL